MSWKQLKQNIYNVATHPQIKKKCLDNIFYLLSEGMFILLINNYLINKKPNC